MEPREKPDPKKILQYIRDDILDFWSLGFFAKLQKCYTAYLAIATTVPKAAETIAVNNNAPRKLNCHSRRTMATTISTVPIAIHAAQQITTKNATVSSMRHAPLAHLVVRGAPDSAPTPN